MKHTEAERLLGGYATDTLSAAERNTLFAAALDHQDLFDALMDEEALRELLADPEAKAQLLAALSRTAPPKAVPFWRRTGVLGAAASLIVAATAGLAYLRSPGAGPPPMKQEAVPVPKAKDAEAPPVAQGPTASVRKTAPIALPKEVTPRPKEFTPSSRAAGSAAPPPPAPSPHLSAPAAAGVPASNMEDGYRANAQSEYRRAEAQDKMAKKSEAPRPAAAMLEAVGSLAPAHSAPPPARAMAKAGGAGRQDAATVGFAPSWTVEARPGGSTRVTVTAPGGHPVVLLRRGASGIEVLKVRATEDGGSSQIQWHAEVRLAEGDVLDLYVLNAPTADPAMLPETGSVDGFRARIHPAGK